LSCIPSSGVAASLHPPLHLSKPPFGNLHLRAVFEQQATVATASLKANMKAKGVVENRAVHREVVERVVSTSERVAIGSGREIKVWSAAERLMPHELQVPALWRGQ